MNEKQWLETDEIEIDLVELFYALLKKWWAILITALLGAAIAIGFTKFMITPMYQSEAMLFVVTNTTSITSVADLQIGTAITRDFEIIATSKPVIDGAIEQIEREHGLEFTRAEVSGMITIENPEDTRILKIKVKCDNPEDACIIANAVAEQTSSRMAEIMKADPPTTVEFAEVSKAPVSPSLAKNTILGFLLGALAVCAILVVEFLMNDSIKTKKDIERYLGEATLAVIPLMKGNKGRKQKGVKSGKVY